VDIERKKGNHLKDANKRSTSLKGNAGQIRLVILNYEKPKKIYKSSFTEKIKMKIRSMFKKPLPIEQGK